MGVSGPHEPRDPGHPRRPHETRDLEYPAHIARSQAPVQAIQSQAPAQAARPQAPTPPSAARTSESSGMLGTAPGRLTAMAEAWAAMRMAAAASPDLASSARK